MFDESREQQTERTYSTPPPIPDEQLVLVYKIWRRKHESKYIPKDYLGAAKWWLEHQEPQGHNEEPQLDRDKKGEPHWKSPYIERVCATWLTFLAFSEPQKAFVVQHIESGVPYRGDDIWFYQAVVEESAVMLEAQATPETWEKYITDGFAAMRAAARRMQA